ncbi:hypothetical protein DSO57_1025323, partial [Entomophthora muscae]
MPTQSGTIGPPLATTENLLDEIERGEASPGEKEKYGMKKENICKPVNSGYTAETMENVLKNIQGHG